jgi:hypothetical protein
MSTTPTFFGLHGLDGAQFDPQTVWREKESTGTIGIVSTAWIPRVHQSSWTSPGGKP